MTPGTADERITARHEVGHALATVLIGGRFRYVTLRPRGGDHLAHVQDISTDSAWSEAVVLWAGPYAEKSAGGALADAEAIESIDPEYLHRYDEDSPSARAAQLVAEYADLIDHLADRLLAARTIQFREFLGYIQEWMRTVRSQGT